MSGDLGLLRMLLRMSLQRETGLELRASTFQDTTENFCLLTTRDGNLAGGPSTLRKGMVAQRQVEWLKAERAR